MYSGQFSGWSSPASGQGHGRIVERVSAGYDNSGASFCVQQTRFYFMFECTQFYESKFVYV